MLPTSMCEVVRDTYVQSLIVQVIFCTPSSYCLLRAHNVNTYTHTHTTDELAV